MAERARTQAGQDEVPTGDWLTELLDWLKYILLALLIGLLWWFSSSSATP
jgi:hypothetical protein